MLYLILGLASALIIEAEYDLEDYFYIGQFSGSNLTVEFSAKIVSDLDQSAKVQLGLQRSASPFLCSPENETNLLALSTVRSQTLELSSVQGYPIYFYLSQCSSRSTVKVSIKLTVKDSDSLHYSAEYSYFYYILSVSISLHVVVILSAIYGIYKENNEEVPLALIFIISLIYTISLMFHFLYVWIFGVDGTSFRFILIFSKFFEVFARISLIGILLLISANRFKPTDFSIEEKEFVYFMCMIGFEFLMDLIGIARYDVLRHYDMWTGLEGLLVFCARLGIVFAVSGFNFNKIGTRIKGFSRVDGVLKVYVLLPVVLSVLWSFLGSSGKGSLLFGVDNLSVLFGLSYLLVKFLSVNFGGVLPFKSHNF